MTGRTGEDFTEEVRQGFPWKEEGGLGEQQSRAESYRKRRMAGTSYRCCWL